MKKLLIIASSLLLAATAQAAVYQVYTGTGATIVNPSLALASGNIFAGHFDELDGDGNPQTPYNFAGKTLADLWSDVNIVGSGFGFASGVRANAGAQALNSNGTEIYEQIYLFVFEGGNSPGTATSYGVFTAPVYYSDVTDPNNPDTIFTVSNQLAGTQAVNGLGTISGSNQFQLVPEPSTAVLGLMAGLGLVTRRRRA